MNTNLDTAMKGWLHPLRCKYEIDFSSHLLSLPSGGLVSLWTYHSYITYNMRLMTLISST